MGLGASNQGKFPSCLLLSEMNFVIFLSFLIGSTIHLDCCTSHRFINCLVIESMPPILVVMRSLVFLLTMKQRINGLKFSLPTVSCLLVAKYDTFSCSLTFFAPCT